MSLVEPLSRNPQLFWTHALSDQQVFTSLSLVGHYKITDTEPISEAPVSPYSGKIMTLNLLQETK